VTLLELNLVDSLEAIADHTPIHADELRRCARRVKALIDELDHCRAACRDAAVLVKGQREELDALKVAQGNWP